VGQKFPFTPEEFKAIYSKVPRLCVDLVILHEGKCLLTLRKSHGWENLWHMPGGTVYFQESIENAAKRVAKSEVGIDIKVNKLLGYIEYFDEAKVRGFGYTITMVLECEALSTSLVLDEQASEGNWFSQLPENTITEQKNFLSKLGFRV
jgi:ADP-ribose pyrophosphatase YjhB (NUDIX family)